MEVVTLSAHFDGDKILLDEYHHLEPNTKLVVTVLPEPEADGERGDWLAFSQAGLQRAYGEDEPEYSLDMLQEINPHYDPR